MAERTEESLNRLERRLDRVDNISTHLSNSLLKMEQASTSLTKSVDQLVQEVAVLIERSKQFTKIDTEVDSLKLWLHKLETKEAIFAEKISRLEKLSYGLVSIIISSFLFEIGKILYTKG